MMAERFTLWEQRLSHYGFRFIMEFGHLQPETGSVLLPVISASPSIVLGFQWMLAVCFLTE